MIDHAACLMAGDITEYGTVKSVRNVGKRNSVVQVTFVDGTKEYFTRFQLVEYTLGENS